MTIGQCPNDQLRAILGRRGIEGSQVDGRNVIAERWAQRIADIRKAAADRAEADYLASQEG